MSLAKQGLWVLAIAAAVLVIWVLYVPTARPLLDRVGLLGPMERIGIVTSDTGATASPNPRSAGMGGPARVIARPPEQRRIDDIVTAIGTGIARRSVTVAPEIEGRVVALGAASGDRVAEGTVLVELDSQAARIAVARAELVLADAREDLERLSRLSTSGAVTDLQRREAELARRTAELELEQARFELSQHRVLAPVQGWVGILEVEVGDQVSRGAVITRLDDRSSIEVDFRVPERLVGRIALGDRVQAAPLSAGAAALEGTVSALDNRVDEASRTLRIRATIPNPEDRLRPGMAFTIRISLPGEPRPAVDPLAIQWGSDGAFVWVVREGRAQRVKVQILQRNADSVLIQAALRPDDLVVIEGVQALRPNASVEVVEPSGSLGATLAPSRS